MGLNFTTTTLINSNLDPDSGVGVVLFEAGKAPIDGVEKDVVRIKRDFTFVKDNIKVVRKKTASDPIYCEAEIDFAALLNDLKPEQGTNYCKLSIYVEYEGAQPFYGANHLNINKGIPFVVEFSVKKNATAEGIAAAVAKAIKKDQVFLLDKNIIEISVNGAVLTLSGNTEYMRFKRVAVGVYGDVTEDVIAELGEEGIKLVERGQNGFGTYSQIVKDLRLPTAANYQWNHIRQSETPIIGCKYDQFIVEYCAPASNDGLSFVGHRGMSHTTHIFWVNQAVSGDFEQMFDEVDDVDSWLEARSAQPAQPAQEVSLED